METLTAPLIHSHKPANFQERGVAVPFTTPTLAGARIRPAERTGTEFVLPNPSGGRGVYILSWGNLRQLCRPTVHDTLLHQRISRLPVMDPSGVRIAARKLASEGVAGHEASVAAAASLQADRNEMILANFLLLIMLMEQVEPAGLQFGAETERTPELDRRARRIITEVGKSIGRDTLQVIQDLETLSALFVPIGLQAELRSARLPRLAARLDDAANGLTSWSGRFSGDDSANLALSLGRSAAVTAGCAATNLQAARSMTEDMPGLLRAWAGTPTEIANQAGRSEWILDGWERFCLLWETADHASAQRAVLHEMAQLVPMLPREGNDLGHERRQLDQLEPTLRAAQLNGRWQSRTPARGQTARNERLQGLIA